MMRSSRIAAAALLAVCLGVGGSAGVAHAQTSPLEKADQLNNQGKALFDKGDFTGAAKKFREAILFSAEGRFYFNLCYTLNKAGQYRDAITACEAVKDHQASNPLIEQADKLLKALRDHVRNTNQDPDLVPEPTTDPNTDPNADPTTDPTTDPNADPNADPYVDPNASDPNAPPPPAAGGVVEPAAAPPLGQYKWAVGGELGFVGSSLGNANDYASGGGMFRGHADFLLAEGLNLGAQGYLQFTGVAADELSSGLQVVDLGAALFQHRRISDRLWWSWLGGAHIALLTPESLAENVQSLATLGFRGEGGLHYLLGERGQHSLSALAGLNIYLPAQQGSSDFDPMFYGLDKSASTWGITVGYTMRFATPFGSAPVFTLE
jgi:tetratricopeptide (TPR) repeat protein